LGTPFGVPQGRATEDNATPPLNLIDCIWVVGAKLSRFSPRIKLWEMNMTQMHLAPSIKEEAWDRFFGYYSAELQELNADQLNWNTDAREFPCQNCSKFTGLGGPVAGSYGSTLQHFERAIGGELPNKRKDVRLLILFQDPRGRQYGIAKPLKDPASLADNEHRYFCLSIHAWNNLQLSACTGFAKPSWPSRENAHHYLRRYLRRIRRDCWSYDGFIAYFLYLFQPEMAYITNVAKCHFGASQKQAVFKTCRATHLTREWSSFRPNLVLSFTQKMQTAVDISTPTTQTGDSIPVLRLWHPGSRKSALRKREAFTAELECNKVKLEHIGYNVVELCRQWVSDCAVRIGRESVTPSTAPHTSRSTTA
jgi:hypothetical protein